MEKSTVWIPKNYSSKLSLKETEIAIKKVKDFFEENLSKTLNLTRVSAPLFLKWYRKACIFRCESYGWKQYRNSSFPC